MDGVKCAIFVALMTVPAEVVIFFQQIRIGIKFNSIIIQNNKTFLWLLFGKFWVCILGISLAGLDTRGKRKNGNDGGWY